VWIEYRGKCGEMYEEKEDIRKMRVVMEGRKRVGSRRN
jgi:hypothetical protein